jgi:predicted nucleic acid-binding protein
VNFSSVLLPSSTDAMQKSPLVAIDTNIPLLLAEGDDTTIEALKIVRERMRPADIFVPPTVQGELLHQAECNPSKRLRALAEKALIELRSRWQFHPTDLSSNQEAIVGEAVRKILFAGLIPAAEINDATIIAESAVLNSILLVSNDSHLLKADHRRLGLLFRELELPVPLIVSPHEVVRKFYR